MNGRQQKLLYKLLRFMPVKRSKVVLLDNFGGMNLSELHIELQSRCPELDVVFITVSRQPKRISMKSFVGIINLVRANVIVVNNHIDMDLPFRRETHFVQLWHGAFPIKKIGQMMLGAYKEALAKEPELLDAIMVCSDKAAGVFSESFGVSKAKVLPLGNPSLDKLFTHQFDSPEQYKIALGVNPKLKTILYAPTFRENQSPSVMLDALDLDMLSKNLPENTVLLMRLHRNTRTFLPEQLPENVINVSDWTSTSDVLMASDALVSDYSGLIFEYSILERPIVLFPYDLDEYSDPLKERGLNINYSEELPFPIVFDACDLLSEIISVPFYNTENVQKFKDHWFYYQDGLSVGRISDYVSCYYQDARGAK